METLRDRLAASEADLSAVEDQHDQILKERDAAEDQFKQLVGSHREGSQQSEYTWWRTRCDVQFSARKMPGARF